MLTDQSGTAKVTSSMAMENENYVLGLQLSFSNGEVLNLQPLDVMNTDSRPASWNQTSL